MAALEIKPWVTSIYCAWRTRPQPAYTHIILIIYISCKSVVVVAQWVPTACTTNRRYFTHLCDGSHCILSPPCRQGVCNLSSFKLFSKTLVWNTPLFPPFLRDMSTPFCFLNEEKKKSLISSDRAFVCFFFLIHHKY